MLGDANQILVKLKIWPRQFAKPASFNRNCHVLTQNPYFPGLRKMFLMRPKSLQNFSRSRSRMSWGRFPKKTRLPSLREGILEDELLKAVLEGLKALDTDTEELIGEGDAVGIPAAGIGMRRLTFVLGSRWAEKER